MQYIEQSAGSIRLCVVKGSFDYAQLTILSEENITWNNILVRIGVLGESHFIQFTTGIEVLNEVCACISVVTLEESEVFVNDFLPNVNEKSLTTHFSDFVYTFDFGYHTWEKGIKLLGKLTERDREEKNVFEITHTFPANNKKCAEPVTQIFVIQKEILQISTFHTYPNEQIIVSTKSILKAHMS